MSFFQTIDVMKPAGIKVVGRLAMVRNSIGSGIVFQIPCVSPVCYIWP